MSERSDSTKRGLRAEELVRRAVGGKKGACDVHTAKGGFEIRWGPTSKNAAGHLSDVHRAEANGGYCVQVAGEVPEWMRGDVRSLYDFLRDHDHNHWEATFSAAHIRRTASGDSALLGDPSDDQMVLGLD